MNALNARNHPSQLAHDMDEVVNAINAAVPERPFPGSIEDWYETDALLSPTPPAQRTQSPSSDLWVRMKEKVRQFLPSSGARSSADHAPAAIPSAAPTSLPPAPATSPDASLIPSRALRNSQVPGHHDNAIQIRAHNGLYNLSDIHRIAGGRTGKFPGNFVHWNSQQALIARLRGSSRFAPYVRATDGDSWGHYELALAYARWLNLPDPERLLLQVCLPVELDEKVLAPVVPTPPQTPTQTPQGIPALRRAPERLTMSSLEIAELVGSRHDNVKRSIVRLAKANVIRLPPKEFSGFINNLGLNQKSSHYVFSGEQGKRDSIIVVAQLSPESVPKIEGVWNSKVVLPKRSAISQPVHAIPAIRGAIERMTMSSREIAELTGKELSNVHRDIRSMLVELHGSEYVASVVPEHYRNRHAEFIRENADAILGVIAGHDSRRNHADKRGFAWERDKRGYITTFRLDHTHTLTLVSGYSVILRKRIIERWMELERQASIGVFNVPQTLQDALRLAADLLDENQTLKLENETLKQALPPRDSDGQPEPASRLPVPLSDSGELTVRDTAYQLQVPVHWFYAFLRDKKLLLHSGTVHRPHPRYLKKGLFAYRPSVWRGKPSRQLVITDAGRVHIRQLLNLELN